MSAKENFGKVTESSASAPAAAQSRLGSPVSVKPFDPFDPRSQKQRPAPERKPLGAFERG